MEASSSTSYGADEPGPSSAPAVIPHPGSFARVKLQFKDEIRVVRLDRNSTLQGLKNLIINIYDELRDKCRASDISIKYEDGSGDLISVHSDDEVQIALEELTQVPKFLISIAEPEPEPEPEPERPKAKIKSYQKMGACRFFLTNDCRHGSRCKFLHQLDDKNAQDVARMALAGAPNNRIESWLRFHLEKNASDNIEYLSSNLGLQSINNIAEKSDLSQTNACLLARLLAKDEIRSSMLRQKTNQIYGSLTSSKYLLGMHAFINSINPTAENVEPFVHLAEELQLRTAAGWKEVPLDSLKGAVEGLPTSSKREDLTEKISRLLQQKKRIQRSLAVSEPDRCLKGVDFRQTRIIPGQEELLLQENRTLPVNKIGMRYVSIIEYLETHFRLLREDFIEPLRNGIRDYRNGIHSADVRVYSDVRIEEMLPASSGIEYRVSFKIDKKKDISWASSKRLMFGALLCLSCDGFQTFIWTTIAGRDTKSLSQGTVVIQLVHDMDNQQNLDTTREYVMVESASAYFEAYSHTLRSLQREDMEAIPFKEHLLSLEPSVKAPEYLLQSEKADVFDFESVFPEMENELGTSFIHLLQPWPEWACGLDDSQKLALKHGLTKRLALIQGPPGTGKTFIGSLIVRLLLTNLKADKLKQAEVSSNIAGPIMVVCYTNHALDQFLENIYMHEKQLIRIGGRGKSEKLQGCNLQQRVQKHRDDRNLPPAQVRAASDAKQKKWVLEQKMNSCVKLLNTEYVARHMLYGVATEEQINSLFQGHAQCAIVKFWLLGSINDPFPSFEGVDNFNDEVGDNEDWVQVPKKTGIKIKHNSNLQAPENPDGQFPLHLIVDTPDVWVLPVVARKRLHQYWLDEIRSAAQTELANVSKEYQNACSALSEVDREIQLSILRKSNIIGMTTSAAAKYHETIVSMKPEIVIVEEAAEVLESHILACLSPSTKHVILIGDHKQLRPSTATYKLTIKHKLDVSLFERLVVGGIDHVTLLTQRRMKPSISKLIANIYPDLKNHPRVYGYKDIKGVKSSLFFFDHRAQEKETSEASSKVNIPEAKLIVEFCNYLLNQGCYKPTDIVILAMYGGQVEEIKTRLHARLKNHPFLSITPIGSPSEPEISPTTFPRVSSVDDFQGEEATIILLSLVRNDVEGGRVTIGFLKSENRVCVALSRAREGFYIFGNANLLSGKSRLWGNVIQNLKDTGCIGPELILCCQRHQNTETAISVAEQFKQVEDGGCSQQCEYQLQCGHACPRRCHIGTHETMFCSKKCLKPLTDCPHRCMGSCHMGEECPPCQVLVEKYLPSCGHISSVPCSKPAVDPSCISTCSKLLSCGHQCIKRCGKPCNSVCNTRVLKDLPCSHSMMLECHQDPRLISCKKPCEGNLPGCLHKCKGTCGRCKTGTQHTECREKCGRDLPCGHSCKDMCSLPCSPCTVKCQKKCLHSRCSLKCGEPCIPCMEPCPWKCEHFACDLLCYEICERPRCDLPCNKKLDKCGHSCIGMCGEPCPSMCRICDPDTLDVISQIKLEDSDTSDRFIQLIDCGHLFEVTGLDQWMDMNESTSVDGESSVESQAIKLKTCPQCRHPIRRTYRYSNIVKKSVAQVEMVKRRIYGYNEVRHGIKMLEKNEHMKASKCFRKAIQLNPGLPEAHLNLAIVYCVEEKFYEAISHLRIVVSQSFLVSKLETIPKLVEEKRYNPLPARVQMESLTNAVSRNMAIRALIQWASACTGISQFADAVRICEIVLQHDANHKDASNIMKSAQNQIKMQVVRAVSAEVGTQGHWYECPNGHIYAIGECGGATQESRCPDCDAIIGGGSHSLAAGNRHSTIDGSTRPAYGNHVGLGDIGLL